MSTLAAAALLLALLLLATWAHWRFWQARLCQPDKYDLVVDLTLQDGMRAQLRRLQPAQPDTLPPILLVHGIAIDHHNLDVLPQVSLARHLQSAGRDVWLLTLRSGLVQRWRDWPHVRFSRMVRHDVPEAVAEVLRRTGQPQLDYLGFSMGGMLAYAALGRTLPEAQIRRVVIMGSPAHIVPPLPGLSLLKVWPKALWPWLPVRLPSQLLAPWSEWAKTPAQSLVCQPHNMTPGAMRRTAAQAAHSIAPALLKQLFDWAFAGKGVMSLGGQPVLQGLTGLSVPVLFVAGKGDRLASPGSVARAFEAWGCDHPEPVRHILVLGRPHASADYGHLDLAAGRSVVAEVFAPIAAFLSAPNPAAADGFVPPQLLPATRSGHTRYHRPTGREAA